MNTAEKNHSDFPNRKNFPSQQHGRRKYNRAKEIWKASHNKKKHAMNVLTVLQVHQFWSTPILELNR